MAQYKIGTANVTNNSEIVTGNGTLWLANLTAGKSSFKINGSNVIYTIASVDSDTQIHLTAVYAGPTANTLNYICSNDFTPNYDLYEPDFNDVDWPVHIRESTRKLDKIVFSKTNIVPEDFGALGDGISDDSDSIINAIAYIKINGGSLYINKFYFITKKISWDFPLTIFGNGASTSGFIVSSIGAYTALEARPVLAAWDTGASKSIIKDLKVIRNSKDWINNSNSIGISIGYKGCDTLYLVGVKVINCVIENFGTNLLICSNGYSHYHNNTLYDWGVYGIYFTSDVQIGLGNNSIIGNNLMGDTQYHLRNFNVYQGTTLEAKFGGTSARPTSTKMAAWYDLVLPYQICGIFHEYGGGNKFLNNKVHFAKWGIKVKTCDGFYFTQNQTEFILYQSLNITLNSPWGSNHNITVKGNEFSFAREFTDYSYFTEDKPVGIYLNTILTSMVNSIFEGNVFPSRGESQTVLQNLVAFYIDGDANAKYDAIVIRGNTGYGCNVGIKVNSLIQADNCAIRTDGFHSSTFVYPPVGGFVEYDDINNILIKNVNNISGSVGETLVLDSSNNIIATPVVRVLDGYAQYSVDSSTYAASYKRAANSSAGANVLFRKSRGTLDIPTTVLQNDVIGGLRYEGYSPTGFVVGSTSAVFAAEDWTSTAHGTYYQVNLIKQGTTQIYNRFNITGVGDVELYPDSKLYVAGLVESTTGFKFPDGTTQTTAAVANNLKVYSSAFLVASNVTKIDFKNGLSASLVGDTVNVTLTLGTSDQYFRGDRTLQTLNQAAVAGLTTAASPSFVNVTLSGKTLGSVLFVDTSGVISEDNANLFWDNTNKRLSIGSTATTFPLEINSASDVSSAIRVYNTNSSGTTANAQCVTKSDSSQCSIASHGTGRTATRYGIVIGGYSELISGVGNGLLIGTSALAKPIVFGTNSIERARMDENGNFRVGADVTNNVTLNVTNGIVLNGTATVWKDVFFPMAPPKTTGEGNPTLVTWNTPLRGYAFAVNDVHDFDPQEFPHDGKQGATTGSWHIHWISRTDVAATRGVKWQLEYSFIDINGVFQAPTTISVDVTVAANTADKTHLITTLGTFTTPNIGAQFFCRLTRIASATTAPATNPVVIGVHFHYELDTMGSQNITTK